MANKRKRIVTGHDEQGRSIIVSDGPSPAIFEVRSGIMVEDLWRSHDLPPRHDETFDPTEITEFQLGPAPGGSLFNIVVVPPIEGRMHTTETLDYIVVISGEIHLILDEGEVKLGPGDSVIQRGTNHAWTNRGTEPAIMAAVMISTREAD